MRLDKSLKNITHIMNRLSVQGIIKGYALIGGLSVSVWKAPRATCDIDILVSLETEHMNKFCKALSSEGLAPEVIRGSHDDPVPCLIKVSHEGVPVDILVSTRKWENEAISNAVQINFLGATLPVVSAEYLIVMKLKSGGPRDMLDAEELLQIEGLDKKKIETLAKRLRVDKRLTKTKRKK